MPPLLLHLMRSKKVVTPLKNGVQGFPKTLETLDSGWSLSASGGPE
jgi:hypothetical protein